MKRWRSGPGSVDSIHRTDRVRHPWPSGGGHDPGAGEDPAPSGGAESDPVWITCAGQASLRSDIDLCLEAPTLRLGELLLPWRIDLQLKHLIDHATRLEHIARAGVVLSDDQDAWPGPRPQLAGGDRIQRPTALLGSNQAAEIQTLPSQSAVMTNQEIDGVGQPHWQESCPSCCSAVIRSEPSAAPRPVNLFSAEQAALHLLQQHRRRFKPPEIRNEQQSNSTPPTTLNLPYPSQPERAHPPQAV